MNMTIFFVLENDSSVAQMLSRYDSFFVHVQMETDFETDMLN